MMSSKKNAKTRNWLGLEVDARNSFSAELLIYRPCGRDFEIGSYSFCELVSARKMEIGSMVAIGGSIPLGTATLSYDCVLFPK